MNFNVAIYPIIGFGLAVNYYASDNIEYHERQDEFVSETEQTVQVFLGVFVIELSWFND